MTLSTSAASNRYVIAIFVSLIFFSTISRSVAKAEDEEDNGGGLSVFISSQLKVLNDLYQQIAGIILDLIYKTFLRLNGSFLPSVLGGTRFIATNLFNGTRRLFSDVAHNTHDVARNVTMGYRKLLTDAFADSKSIVSSLPLPIPLFHHEEKKERK